MSEFRTSRDRHLLHRREGVRQGLQGVLRKIPETVRHQVHQGQTRRDNNLGPRDQEPHRQGRRHPTRGSRREIVQPHRPIRRQWYPGPPPTTSRKPSTYPDHPTASSWKHTPNSDPSTPPPTASTSPKNIPTPVAQASAAARTTTVLNSDKVEIEPIVAEVNRTLLRVRNLRRTLPLQRHPTQRNRGRPPRRSATLYKGCGTCAAACPNGTMDQNHSNKYQRR